MRYRQRGAPIIHDTIDNETIAINQSNGAYYSLEGPAALVWQLLANGVTTTEAAGRLAADYAAESEALELAVGALPGRAGDRGAGSRRDRRSQARTTVPQTSTPPPMALTGAAKRQPFTSLSLQRYTDLEVMLLADPIHEVDDTGWPMPLADRSA